MKKLLSLFLLLCISLGGFAACAGNGGGDNSSSSTSSEAPEIVDYASQVTLDMNSETQKQEVTVKNYIDGDTTHFNVPTSLVATGLLKARYQAVNTPESTGKIEKWGKKASNFTKEKLKSASSIILETDSTEWEVDSTGERYLVWVWYKAEGSDTYRNLNLELLQNGLAVGSKAGNTRYGDVCTKLINQAVNLQLHVYSTEKDPDFYEGKAVELDLKELRLNATNYVGIDVAFEATVSYYSNQGVYLENYDEATDMYYGVYAYYGFNTLDADGREVLSVGNRVRVVGNFQYYETGGTYQVCDMEFDLFDPENPNNIQLISEGTHSAANVDTTIEKFNSQVDISIESDEGVETKTYKYSEIALATSIGMKNLYVADAYTTNNGGDNDGAISLTCEVDGKTITVRTIPMSDANGNLVSQSQLIGKTIDVVGVIDSYNGTQQIKVFSFNNITIH